MIKLPSNNQFSEHLLKFFCWTSGLLIVVLFFFLLQDLIWHGLARISPDYFFTEPLKAGREGGVASMLVSTLILLLLCLFFALPIGIATAIYLAEYADDSQFFARFIRYSLNLLASVPSIVMGLFGYAFFVVALNLGFSLLSGALTLSCMILPLLIRSIEDSLRCIPEIHRLNAHALGLSETKILYQILLPLASQGIVLAIILSVGRAMAETAALLYTSGYVTRMPESVLDSGRSLSVHIFDLSMNVPGGEQSAYASALVLIVLLLFINLLSHRFGILIKNRSIL